jgi:hypothetical protein
MVSAFHTPNIARRTCEEDPLDLCARSPSPATVRQDQTAKPSADGQNTIGEIDMSETEDEEVKVNCVGGVQAYMTTTDEEALEDDESCCSEEPEEDLDERGIVNFVARQVCQAPEIYRPRPMLGGIAENDDADASSACSEPLGEAELDMDDQGSASSEDDSTDADDERSDDEDEEVDEDDERIDGSEQEESDEDENDDDSTSSEMSHAESVAKERRLDSPPILGDCFAISASQGTPEVCDEEESYYNFEDYDEQSTNIIDKVLALNSATSQLPSTDISPSSRSKRILSSLFSDDDRSIDYTDTPKRMRCTLSTPAMADLFLGPSAYDALEEPKRGDTTVSPFSEQEAEQDKVLSEELAEAEAEPVNDRESTPVPLLSPPPSPLCVESDKGQLTTVCEWPSNLAVDCALLITGQRTHSPVSFVGFEEEEDRFVAYYQGLDSGTSLTPLLKGIRVSLDYVQ